MAQIKLINLSGRTIALGEPVKLHDTKPNSFDYAPLGTFGLIGHAAQQITFGSWGLINLLGSGGSVIGTDETTPLTLEQITTYVLSQIPPLALFSITDTTQGATPGSNNKGANYYLNAKRGWTIPSGTITGSGERLSSVHAGALNEMSLDNDYLYICVQSGSATYAIWKKALLFQSV